VSEKNVALFEKYGVLNRRELEARYEVYLEQYFKTINIEGETAADIARTMILPGAIRYLSELASAVESLDAVGVKGAGVRKGLEEVNALIDELRATLDVLVAQNLELGGDEVASKAQHMRDNIIPAMEAVREVADRLEKVLPDDLWPLPTYRDMLFVK
jgi:glutamine synthetase